MSQGRISQGRFITLEGGEGVGKSTQVATVREALLTAQLEVIVTREPGGTARAERIRELLLERGDEAMPQICELLLMFAARSTHLANLILPALQRGAWVVCDRFIDATYAYQGYGRGVSQQHIANLEEMVQTGLKPDLTLLFDAPVELALSRAKSRNHAQGNAAGDRFENEQHAFYEKVRIGYLAQAAAEPKRFVVIDAATDLNTVKEAVRSALRQFIATHCLG